MFEFGGHAVPIDLGAFIAADIFNDTEKLGRTPGKCAVTPAVTWR